jgi:hypothetical protein
MHSSYNRSMAQPCSAWSRRRAKPTTATGDRLALGRFLSADYRVRVVERWDGAAADLMIALHARRSAASVADWAAQMVKRPLLLVLTGTDLYRDIAFDADAQRSLALADTLVVLNEHAIADLPAEHRAKGVVCILSAPRRARLGKTNCMRAR